MRLFEVLLILACFAMLLLPRQRQPLASKIVAGLGVAFSLAHFVLEGYRWQMYPAYFVLLVYVVLHFTRHDVAPSRLKNLAKVLGIFATLNALAFARLFPVDAFSVLDGDYDVGTSTFYYKDINRPEIYTENPNDVRELMVQIWYPAEVADEPLVDYVQNIDVSGPAIANAVGIPKFILNHARLVKSRSYHNPLVAEDGPFPVVLFSHGLGGIRTQNTQQIEALVSKGYIVAAVDHPYASAFSVYPDGRVALYDSGVLKSGTAEYEASAQLLVSEWVADLDYMLGQLELLQTTPGQRFEAKLNLEQLGVFGHSTGGGATIEFCYRNERCKGAVGLDPWLIPTSDEAVNEGINQPILMLHTPKLLSDINAGRTKRFFEQTNNRAYMIEIEGTRHFDFSDLPRLSPLLDYAGLTGDISADDIGAIMDVYTVAFFDHHLRGWGGAELYVESAEFPQITITTK